MSAVVPFYENDYFSHNLPLGTLHNRAGTKMCYMPGELFVGIQRALEDETGPAWRLILKRCGEIWGARVAKRFEEELRQFYGRAPGELPMEEFARIVEAHFRYHGWGNLELEWDHAERGLITATLSNSGFAEMIGSCNAPIDALVSGLLAALIGRFAERSDIVCYETECVAMGADRCRFILGSEARLAKVPDWIEDGTDHETIIELLT